MKTSLSTVGSYTIALFLAVVSCSGQVQYLRVSTEIETVFSSVASPGLSQCQASAALQGPFSPALFMGLATWEASLQFQMWLTPEDVVLGHPDHSC